MLQNYKNISWSIPGFVALLIIVSIISISFVGVASYFSLSILNEIISDTYVIKIAIFTVGQALLSTIISVLLSIPFALFTAKYYQHTLVRLILSLGWLAFVTPVIIGVFGIIKIHGVSGFISNTSVFMGGQSLNYLYGLSGIILAHIFFNMPFSARNIVYSLNNIPEETWRLSAQLNLSRWQVFKFIEWPAIRNNIFATAGVIFALCFTSFAVVLTLGGGPKSTILEVAIYYALRIEFDIDRAISLGIIQIILASLIVIAIVISNKSILIEPHQKIKFDKIYKHKSTDYIIDILGVTIGIVTFLLPIIAIISSSLMSISSELLFQWKLLHATLWSLILGLSSGLLSLSIGMGLLVTMRELLFHKKYSWITKVIEFSGNIILIFPPILLGVGMFLALRSKIDIFTSAPLLIITINAITSLPFILRILGPEFMRAGKMHNKLCKSLNIRGFVRFRYIDFPVIKSAIASAFAVSASMALGDLGMISLFGSPEITTLPLYIYQSMGSYKMDQASVGITVLMLLTLTLIYGSEKITGEQND
ncbi:MAG: ABC transporter permease subunit [Alphaproteobacteria bacterium]